MKIYIENPLSRGKKLIIILVIGCLIAEGLLLGIIIPKSKETESVSDVLSALPKIQDNSLMAISNPSDPVQPVQKLKMVITAYSSTVWQTNDDPFTTASGKRVKDGIIANNLLSFGTKIRIPEIYGEKIFVVEDRMHSKNGYYHIDIWFSEYWQAKNFGRTTAYIEILEN